MRAALIYQHRTDDRRSGHRRGSGRSNRTGPVMTLGSSGTRLTHEFRYLPDMINIVVSVVGWFRVAANSAGVRGRGQGSAGRPTAQRRGLDAGTGRRILSVAGPPVPGWRTRHALWPGRAGSDGPGRSGRRRTAAPNRRRCTPARCGRASGYRPDSWCPRTTRTRRSPPPASRPSRRWVGGDDRLPCRSQALQVAVSGLRRCTCSATSTSRWKIRTR